MANDASESSVVIVGAGIFGTSTAYHLSQVTTPSRITIIDRHTFPSPPANADNAPYGASHDINKIVRADYSVPFYMDLAQEAIEQWQEWDLIKPYYHRTGWAMMNEEGSDLAQRIRRNFKECSVKHETRDMTFDEIKQSWGGVLKDVDTQGFDTAYWNPGAGWAEADRAVEAMLQEAVMRGVQYCQGQVTKLCVREDASDHAISGVQLQDGRVISAGRVLLATGAWTSSLMNDVENALSIASHHRAESQSKAAGVCVVHFELDDVEKARYDKLPVIVYGPNGEILPPPSSKLLKFTNAASVTNYMDHSTGTNGQGSDLKISISVPAPMQREVPESLKQETLSIVKRTMPSFVESERKVAYWRICWDGVTPQQQQLITKHPDQRLSNLYFAIGGSFHSWKFLPTIGKYVANVVQDISNGREKDEHWAWKNSGWEAGGEKGAHENVIPRRDLKDLA